ncbi:hypothetical protein [Lentzea tibetensis]|uniref:hypothetical protein n=1 Tax=Lentzea tibetensis TaxID=2591470 RepID=UPI001C9A18B8|nr:hypothetical protein [Lentzea tibetensis]
MLRLVGAHLGSLASRDLKTRCADGLQHCMDRWAARKQGLTGASSSRWAGAITKASHEQWGLARRGQAACIRRLEAGVATIERRLALPVGAPGVKREPGGYRSRHEWFAKSRRLGVLQDRLAAVRADRDAGRVRVVRGGRRLLNARHHLDAAELTEPQWRAKWESARMFLSADGESGKPHGNETIRIDPDGQVRIKLPAPLAYLANAPQGRYVLACTVTFRHRGDQWAARVAANQAVAYRIHHDVTRDRWYVTASWQNLVVPASPLPVALAGGVVGVDMNADHLAAWRLDAHGNPVGGPCRFSYDLSGTAAHRDAQVRHALTRLLRWTRRSGAKAIAVEDLDFADCKTRERHGRRKWFRQLISGMPTGRLRARLVSMAVEHGITIVAVDPAYTSQWGAEHWQKPLTSTTRRVSRHDAASVAIGRRAHGYPIRRRTAPPPHDQSDRAGHRTVQAGPSGRMREGSRPPAKDHAHDARSRAGTRTRDPSVPNTVRDTRSDRNRAQLSLLLTEQERCGIPIP